jgi:hypothetical protein
MPKKKRATSSGKQTSVRVGNISDIRGNVNVIEISTYKGQMDDLILLATSDDFGMMNLRIVIQDDQGNLIESGDAAQFEDCSDCWDYVATASVPSGTSVIISAVATDCLWGVGFLSTRITIP